MKIAAQILLIFILGWLSHFVLGWWGICVVAAGVGFLFSPKNTKRSFSSRKQPAEGNGFLVGLIGGLLAWGLPALWANLSNDGILGKRIAALIFNSPQPIYVILVSALLGGLLAGTSCLTGKLLAKALFLKTN